MPETKVEMHVMMMSSFYTRGIQNLLRSCNRAWQQNTSSVTHFRSLCYKANPLYRQICLETRDLPHLILIGCFSCQDFQGHHLLFSISCCASVLSGASRWNSHPLSLGKCGCWRGRNWQFRDFHLFRSFQNLFPWMLKSSERGRQRLSGHPSQTWVASADFSHSLGCATSD